MSRIVDGRFIFENGEKEHFRRLMRRCEAFSGVQVLTYAVLSNHFHILVSIPERKPLSERELVRRLRQLYHPDAVAEIQEQWALWRKQGSEKRVREDMRRFERRMCDVSEFIKTLKQRFTQCLTGSPVLGLLSLNLQRSGQGAVRMIATPLHPSVSDVI
jgi:REP element-mobilizing transposase RayT